MASSSRYESILVACSTFDGKRHCLDRWLRAYLELTYPHKTLLLVDTSDTGDYADYLLERGLSVERLALDCSNMDRITAANARIRDRFLAGTWNKWFSLESDVLVPPATIEFLLSFDRPTDWIGCSYRNRDGRSFASNWGCSLFSRRIMEELDFAGCQPEMSVDCHFWHNKFVPAAQFTFIDLYNFLAPEHM